jgi:ABC-type branched-subunit amino acid transport system substrate-binding protein
MDAQDMADLIAYLKQLEHELDSGLTETAITLGTVLPEGGSSASLGQAIRSVIQAYFDDVNAQGGIYNRQLELKVTGAPTRDLVLERGKELIEGGDVFALVAAVTAGLENELGDVVEEHGVPMIGPFTQFPRDADTLQRFTFYVFGGLTIQAKALLNYASTRLDLSDPRIGVVYPRDTNTQAIAQAIRAQAETRKWRQPVLVDYPAGLMNASKVATKLNIAGVDALVFLGPSAELTALAYESSRRNWVPYVLMAGSLAGRALFDLPAAFQGRIFLAYPTGPADHTRAGVDEFNRFHRRHNLPGKHLPAQIAAYTAVKLLVEGLKAAGRSLSREKLIGALEKLYEFDTGLAPLLTYSANRRIGALGAHIVSVDLEKRTFGSSTDWIAPE